MKKMLFVIAVCICAICVANSSGLAVVSDCPVFPEDNIWNVPVDTLPVDANSNAYITMIGATTGLHPDFGSGLWDGGPIGIPYIEVSGTQPPVPVTFDYNDESDPGPYPIPQNPPIEGGPDSPGDRHILIIDRDNCILYELYYAFPQPDGSWTAGSGAIFDLNSNTLRPAGWTSADAAGLPIYPGLVRYDEVASGEIKHAIRFTAPKTRRAYVWPARHYASSLTGTQYPPMGQRFRLKASFDILGFSPEVQVILTALKKYGMILADNGSSWFISGAPDERWNNDILRQLRQVTGSNFEAVDVSSLTVTPDSGQVRTATPPQTSYKELTINHSSGGVVSAPGEGRFTYATGSVVTLVATPDIGYEFDIWTGDVAALKSPSTTIIMDEDKTVTANFIPKIIHVEDITMSLVLKPKGYSAKAVVRICDRLGKPIAGVMVSGKWSGLASGSVTGKTGLKGNIGFTSKKTTHQGIITFTVTGVSASGYFYDSAQNKETQASISASQNAASKMMVDTVFAFWVWKDLFGSFFNSAGSEELETAGNPFGDSSMEADSRLANA